MDLTTVFGIISLGVLILVGVATHQVTSTLINLHGVLIVMWGTFAAILINTPMTFLVRAVRGLGSLFKEQDLARPQTIIPVMTDLAEQCRMRGMTAMRDTDASIANGFLNRVTAAAMEYNDAKFVQEVIEQEINQEADLENEVANVYRSMGILSPMFGLLGTLIGIIAVLKQLSDPEAVGPAMGVAITSAFYGILFANVVCVPIAGKIRARIWMKVRIKSMILDGVLEIMKGSIPLVVERKLQSYL